MRRTSKEAGPERQVQGAQLKARIEDEVGKLSAKEQVAFKLRHFEGLAIREIAELMGAPEGSVKNNIFRAVRKLRTALEPTSGAQR